MPDDELDELYAVDPKSFTALRSTLTAAAKRRGDTATAKRISAARKPTMAAWVVNRLILQHKESKQRLTELGDRLRAAHATMDGDLIRSLSTEQHGLVNELTRAAFAAAELTNPSATVREDVSGTLQAAIADPDVTAKLGRLTTAERWSGFGGFGEAAAVSRTARPGTITGQPKGKDDAERRQRNELRSAVAEAEQAKADADDTLSARQEELAAARRRHEQARWSLREAERDLDAADNAYDRAEQASRDATQALRDARAQLRAMR